MSEKKPKERDIKELWAKSNNECAICNQDLIYYSSGVRINRGEQAHIYGEKPGSARYDKTKGSDFIRSADNFILLCANHHKEIDQNPSKWTVEKLQEYKFNQEIRRYRDSISYLINYNIQYEDYEEEEFRKIVFEYVVKPIIEKLSKENTNLALLDDFKKEVEHMVSGVIFKNDFKDSWECDD